MLSQEKDGASSRAIDTLKGTLSLGDKLLMSSLSSDDLDKMLLYWPRGELLSRPPGEFAQVQGDALKRKLEDRVHRLLREVTKLWEAKKEAVGWYQQTERERLRSFRGK
ncbi:UNVERIFIED_CONTAM: hypothetical protein Sradi_4007800 [Sesamum radiatum]|uniref:Uncharacterized protein n=1 Tax=Sesamum radiatum TaxID=300843 RepID=A0AAW2PHH6_SESRA